jgi:hypothetical protein
MTHTANPSNRFPYYTGDISLGLAPSDGKWEGRKFIPAQDEWFQLGEWHLPPDVMDEDLKDGQGIVWLNRGE